jgi:glycosyltransferase involved in cell wall biosynthesis
MISVIIPASNEEAYIRDCLGKLLASDPLPDAAPVQVIVVANGCTDATVAAARTLQAAFGAKGWVLQVLELAEGSKIAALNAGDAAASYDRRIYLDADIRVDSGLVAQLSDVLGREGPVYASGQIRVPKARSLLSERYARFWQKLPFITQGVPGCGVFALNAAGRARWGEFPQIISDDSFARHHFTPEEMHAVPAGFDWPITEGFANLVRVRRRQNEGLAEIARRYPELVANMPPTAPDTGQKIGLFFRDPIGFSIYAAVAVAVHLPLFRNRSAWDRGR